MNDGRQAEGAAGSSSLSMGFADGSLRRATSVATREDGSVRAITTVTLRSSEGHGDGGDDGEVPPSPPGVA